jgi:hypothetical protein
MVRARQIWRTPDRDTPSNVVCAGIDVSVGVAVVVVLVVIGLAVVVSVVALEALVKSKWSLVVVSAAFLQQG